MCVWGGTELCGATVPSSWSHQRSPCLVLSRVWSGSPISGSWRRGEHFPRKLPPKADLRAAATLLSMVPLASRFFCLSAAPRPKGSQTGFLKTQIGPHCSPVSSPFPLGGLGWSFGWQ